MRGLRSTFFAAGSAALLVAQTAHAAPVRSIDPLVTLSAMGTAQSNSAVCAAGANAAAAGAAVAQAPATGCVLPVTGSPPPVVGETVAPVAVAPAPVAAAGIGVWPILLGLVALAAIGLAISKGGGGDGDLAPVSPA